jgi:hypothetical protein
MNLTNGWGDMWYGERDVSVVHRDLADHLLDQRLGKRRRTHADRADG